MLVLAFSSHFYAAKFFEVENGDDYCNNVKKSVFFLEGALL